MYIVEVPTKTSKGKLSHLCILLRESYRENGKVKTRTLANLTHLKKEVIEAMKLALKQPEKIVNVDNIKTKSGLSMGSVWCVYQMARKLGIVNALGESHNAKIALAQIIARVIEQGSRLSATRFATNHAVCDILGITQTFNEEHLYHNLEWLSENQNRIEKILFKNRKTNPELFLYDVTSSYLEGQENHFAEYGYNRDGKKSKKQVVLGLLCDSDGNPVCVKVFDGNTNDTKTFGSHLETVKKEFGCESVTFVGDRGMIKSGQIEDVKKAGYHYITSITKAQMETLLNEKLIQMEFFDTQIYEVEDEGIRYILRKNITRSEEIKQNREEKLFKLKTFLESNNTYLTEHPRANADKALLKVTNKLTSLRLNGYVTIALENRILSCNIDQDKLEEISKLDGCYVIKTDLPLDIPKETIHSRYKDLAKVEWAFRTCKTTFLEMRPWYVRTEASTKGHALVVMLAYQIAKALKEAWANENNTVKEILSQLSTICSLEIEIKEGVVLNQIPVPRTELLSILEKANISLPSFLPKSGVIVVSRKDLSQHRKSL